jgi:4-hydroxybenzoate polyprenyltransferase
MRDSTLSSLVLHLRLPFQLLLAPVYLWGWLLASGGLTRDVVVGFVSFHLFLYSGATAFNSYYDRDEGPIGGLERPPAVVPALLPLSLAMKAIGGVLSLAYSHPSVRLKGKPLGSLATVGLGQGGLAFLGGWAATRGDVGSALGFEGMHGAAAATLLILALYPLTQLYQVDEDRARGDHTVAIALGPRGAFRLTLLLQLAGGTLMFIVVGHLFGTVDALLVAAGIGLQMILVAWWAATYDATQIVGNYRRVMRLNILSAGALGGYIVARLSGVLSAG